MKIIISPARRMRYFENEYFDISTPIFLEEAKKLVAKLKELSVNEIESIFKCSRKIAIDTYNRYQNFSTTKNLIPAILAFNGMQYLTMAPQVFTNDEINYVKTKVYILSGLYGLLCPYDGITLYRLDLETKLKINTFDNLYEFWGSKVYDYLYKDNDVIVNLTSKEYRKLISKYLKEENQFIDVFFYQEVNHKLIEKIVYVKEARGAMVRYLASINAQTIEDIIHFNLLGYQFSKELSNAQKIVFIRKEKKHVKD